MNKKRKKIPEESTEGLQLFQVRKIALAGFEKHSWLKFQCVPDVELED